MSPLPTTPKEKLKWRLWYKRVIQDILLARLSHVITRGMVRWLCVFLYLNDMFIGFTMRHVRQRDSIFRNVRVELFRLTQCCCAGLFVNHVKSIRLCMLSAEHWLNAAIDGRWSWSYDHTKQWHGVRGMETAGEESDRGKRYTRSVYTRTCISVRMSMRRGSWHL